MFKREPSGGLRLHSGPHMNSGHPIEKPSAEIQLLLAVARWHTGSGTPNLALDLAHNPPMNWAWVLRSARRHGLLPRLYWLLSSIPEAAPADVLAQLGTEFKFHTARNLQRTGELLRILGCFEAAELKSLPFKGPTLAVYAHGNALLRDFKDLDVLVLKREFARAREILLTLGYRPASKMTRDHEVAYVRTIRQLPLIHQERGLLFELHSHFTARDFWFPIDLEKVFERCQSIEIHGRKVPTLGPEDYLLVVAVHGGKHLWASLGSICDVHQLIHVHPEMDWPWLIEEATRLRCHRLFMIALWLSAHILGSPLPDEVVARLDQDRVVRGLGEQAAQRLFRCQDKLPTTLESVRFFLRARESWRDGISYALSLALTPSTSDWSLFSAPRSLFFVYYLVRPFRLILKAVRNRFLNKENSDR